MVQSEQINEIAAALAKAQSVIENPDKTRMNPHFRAAYADLATGLDCIRPPLSANGIALIQATYVKNDVSWLFLSTRLIHSSGQFLGCDYPVAPVQADHQKLGSALTYAKRQALFSLVGVCGDDDLDGEDAKEGKPVSKALAKQYVKHNVDAKSPPILQQGNDCAERGLDVLRAFWANLTPAEKQEAGGAAQLESWKRIASEVKTREPGEEG